MRVISDLTKIPARVAVGLVDSLRHSWVHISTGVSGGEAATGDI